MTPAATLLLLAGAALAQDDGARAAHVRAEAAEVHPFYDAKTPVVETLPQGTPVRVVAALEPWSKVRVPGGLDVWVHGDYVAWEEGMGRITRDHVRARPLPSTGPESYPLGHFARGDRVVLREKRDDWVRVRAPEHLSAWVMTSTLRIHDAAPEDFAREWEKHAAARAVEPPAPEPEPVPTPPDEGRDDPPPAPGPTDDGVGAEGAGESGTEAASDGARVAEAAAEAPPFAMPAVAKEPARHLALADVRLERFSAAVTEDDRHWKRALADNLERTYGTIIWHTVDREVLDGARRSLARLDALRRFYLASLATRIRRARLDEDPARLAALIAEQAEQTRPPATAPMETAVEVGWVEYRPRVHARIPYVVTRNGHEAAVHSFDGRYRLKDYVGREIAVRGTWRDEPKVPGARVLAITELRVLPVRAGDAD